MNTIEEQIKHFSKQLKVPTFAEYSDVLRQANLDADFGDLLLEFMKIESLSRQENQNRRRLKNAGFPVQKTIHEFDMRQLTSPFLRYSSESLPVVNLLMSGKMR